MTESQENIFLFVPNIIGPYFVDVFYWNNVYAQLKCGLFILIAIKCFRIREGDPCDYFILFYADALCVSMCLLCYLSFAGRY